MNETRLWPLLVAAGRSTSNRLIVIPQFLHDRDRDGLLWRMLVSEDPEPDGKIQTRHAPYPDPEIGEFRAAFFVVMANREDVGEAGGYLQDQFSRPIRMIEGVVITGADGGVQIERDVLALRPLLRSVFQEFWRADDPRSAPFVSQWFLPGQSPQPSLIRRLPEETAESVTARRERPNHGQSGDEPERPSRGQPRKWLLSVAFILVAMLALAGLALLITR